MQLVKPEIMTWRHSNGDPEIVVTDHNRGELSVSVEIIERKARMANGTMRKYIIGKKRSFSITWEMVPTASEAVVGESSLGILGAEGIKDFIEDTLSSSAPCNATNFYMRLYKGSDPRPEVATAPQIQAIKDRGDDVQVTVSEYSWDIVKRGANWEGTPYDFWNISVDLEEV